jgi:nucleotide-binding universal stress UspA family protein
MTSETGSTPKPGLIVVGVDGSSQGDAALAFALDEATRCGDAVEIVTAWTIDIEGAPLMPVYAGAAAGDPEKDAEQIQDDALAAVLGNGTPPVTVSRRIVRGEPGRALVDAAQHARLLVVGSRSLGPIKAAVLGSVSRYVAHHSHQCPVVVVPAPEGRSSTKQVPGDLAHTV